MKPLEILLLNTKGGSCKTTFALLFADTLQGAKIVNWSPQKDLANAAKFTGRHMPVSHDKAIASEAPYIIHDTPSFKSIRFHMLVERADLIIIPTRLGTADLLSLKTAVAFLREKKAVEKARIVFCCVRVHSSTYKDYKAYFETNYTDIKRTKTEIPILDDFERAFEHPVEGEAKQIMVRLVGELGIERK